MKLFDLRLLNQLCLIPWFLGYICSLKIYGTCRVNVNHTFGAHRGFLKWWVSPTTVGFPTKNDQHLGCEMGIPPFKETPIYAVWNKKMIFRSTKLKPPTFDGPGPRYCWYSWTHLTRQVKKTNHQKIPKVWGTLKSLKYCWWFRNPKGQPPGMVVKPCK